MATYPTTTLKPNQTYNPEVVKLQRYLVSQGYMMQADMNSGTGYYGSKTTAAVAKLQSALKVDTAGYPGYWGPKTLTALQTTSPAPPKTITGTTLPGQTTVQEAIAAGAMKPGVAPAPIAPIAPTTKPREGDTRTNPATGVKEMLDPSGTWVTLTPTMKPTVTPTTITAPVIPPVLPPVSPVSVPPVDITAQKASIESQIADIQTKIAMAKTELEKEEVVRNFTISAAQAGASFPDIQKYVASLTKPVKTEEERKKEIYAKYGITGLEEKAFATPTETFESIYKRAFEQSGLADIKTKMEKIRIALDKATDDYNAAIGNINENVWLLEGGRVGRIKKVYDMYEAKASRLQNSYTVLSNEYERGRQRAESVATNALKEIEKGAQRTKEELSYFVKRAEADIKAEKALTKEEEEKELLRYFPEYVKEYKKPTKEYKPPTSYQEWVLAGKPGDYADWKKKPTKPITPEAPMKGFFTKEETARLKAAGVDEDTYTNITKLLIGGVELDGIRDILRKSNLDPGLLDAYDRAVGIEKVRGVPGAKATEEENEEATEEDLTKIINELNTPWWKKIFQ